MKKILLLLPFCFVLHLSLQAQDQTNEEEVTFRDEEYVQQQWVNLIFPKNERNFARELGIYPNPASTTFDLSILAKENEKFSWTLSNMSGQQVKLGKHSLQEGQNVFNIEVYNLPRGIYILQIKIREEILSKRVSLW